MRAWRTPTLSEIIGAEPGAVVVVGSIATVVPITCFKAWRYLWTEWFTSLDHKKIGIMYIAIAGVMLSRALIEAVLIRAQQALAINSPGPVAPNPFAQLFTTHGTIMIFFMAMPFLTLWLTAGGAGLMMASLAVGEFSTGGWSGYPPYTELSFSGGPGPDYWIWAVTLSSISSTMLGATAGAPGPAQDFKIGPAFLETLVLLTSSFTFGMASIALKRGRARTLVLWLVATLLLGLAFLAMEGHDFASMAADHATPDRSGFLSAFFVLVGLHGLHVTIGAIWILVMLSQLATLGCDPRVHVNLIRLSLFWHFLDVIWIAIFSIVYLQGLIR